MAEKPPFRAGMITARTVTAPIAAFIMAGVLYTYSVSSIRAAKRNARLHREADGGQLDMRRESLRRHGVLDKVEGTNSLSLLRNSGKEASEGPIKNPSTKKSKAKIESSDTDNEQAALYKDLEGRRKGQSESHGKEVSRTDMESRLEEFKGRDKLKDLGDKIPASE